MELYLPAINDMFVVYNVFEEKNIYILLLIELKICLELLEPT